MDIVKARHFQIFRPRGILHAYVDGCYDAKTNSYGCGCVFIDPLTNQVIDTCSIRGTNEEFHKFNNIAGEVMGSMIAIEYAIKRGYKKIVLFYDYMGLSKWATGEWKRNNILTQIYHQAIYKYSSNITMEFIKVKGHSNNEYNDLADSLAKSSIGL